jgi:hypothetical protein
MTACGRRGDPVAIMPPEEIEIQKDKKDVKADAYSLSIPSPEGLRGVYTQKSVILTWDEVTGQDIKFYRVYRSTGGDYKLIGETATTAFTDREVKPEVKYLYRVTAVGDSESLPSKELEIVTEVLQ